MAKKKLRHLRVEGNVAYVPLTRGYEAVIDAADAEFIGRFNWSATIAYGGLPYARTKAAVGVEYLLHRLLIDAPKGTAVDHINGDSLDCRRGNLRLATAQQNARNRRVSIRNKAGVKGVFWNKKREKWQATIRADDRQIYLGMYDRIEDAAHAYREAAQRLHGEFASF